MEEALLDVDTQEFTAGAGVTGGPQTCGAKYSITDIAQLNMVLQTLRNYYKQPAFALLDGAVVCPDLVPHTCLRGHVEDEGAEVHALRGWGGGEGRGGDGKGFPQGVRHAHALPFALPPSARSASVARLARIATSVCSLPVGPALQDTGLLQVVVEERFLAVLGLGDLEDLAVGPQVQRLVVRVHIVQADGRDKVEDS